MIGSRHAFCSHMHTCFRVLAYESTRTACTVTTEYRVGGNRVFIVGFDLREFISHVSLI